MAATATKPGKIVQIIGSTFDVEFGEGHLAGAVNGHKEVLAAFFGLDLGEIDV